MCALPDFAGFSALPLETLVSSDFGSAFFFAAITEGNQKPLYKVDGSARQRKLMKKVSLAQHSGRASHNLSLSATMGAKSIITGTESSIPWRGDK